MRLKKKKRPKTLAPLIQRTAISDTLGQSCSIRIRRLALCTNHQQKIPSQDVIPKNLRFHTLLYPASPQPRLSIPTMLVPQRTNKNSFLNFDQNSQQDPRSVAWTHCIGYNCPKEKLFLFFCKYKRTVTRENEGVFM